MMTAPTVAEAMRLADEYAVARYEAVQGSIDARGVLEAYLTQLLQATEAGDPEGCVDHMPFWQRQCPDCNPSVNYSAPVQPTETTADLFMAASDLLYALDNNLLNIAQMNKLRNALAEYAAQLLRPTEPVKEIDPALEAEMARFSTDWDMERNRVWNAGVQSCVDVVLGGSFIHAESPIAREARSLAARLQELKRACHNTSNSQNGELNEKTTPCG